MMHLTIKISDISDGKGDAFKAVIPELNNSIIYADTMGEIFKLLPVALKSAKKNNIGMFKRVNEPDVKRRAKVIAGKVA